MDPRTLHQLQAGVTAVTPHSTPQNPNEFHDLVNNRATTGVSDARSPKKKGFGKMTDLTVRQRWRCGKVKTYPFCLQKTSCLVGEQCWLLNRRRVIAYKYRTSSSQPCPRHWFVRPPILFPLPKVTAMTSPILKSR